MQHLGDVPGILAFCRIVREFYTIGDHGHARRDQQGFGLTGELVGLPILHGTGGLRTIGVVLNVRQQARAAAQKPQTVPR